MAKVTHTHVHTHSHAHTIRKVEQRRKEDKTRLNKTREVKRQEDNIKQVKRAVTCGAVLARSSRILLPATESVTDGFEPEHPIMFAMRVKKEAREMKGDDEDEDEDEDEYDDKDRGENDEDDNEKEEDMEDEDEDGDKDE